MKVGKRVMIVTNSKSGFMQEDWTETDLISAIEDSVLVKLNPENVRHSWVFF